MRIDTKSGRRRLDPRPAPYFARLSKGRFVGFRKLADGSGSWVARYHAEEAKPVSKTLGELGDAFEFDQAADAARLWFKDLDAGITGQTEQGEATIETACRDYVADRRREKGDATAHDADKRFQRTVYGDGKKRLRNRIADIPLAKVRSTQFREWRETLVTSGLSKASVNRTQIALNAALNMAVTRKLVSIEKASAWRDVKPFKGAANRRDLFLDLAQRRALLGVTSGALRNLLSAVMFTGCRAGELVGALCKQFDVRTSILTVTGKTGARPVVLSVDAAGFFSVLTESRASDDYLLVRDDGKRWGHSDWDELVRDAAIRAELPSGTCLYTLRHSWITQALLDGMSTLEVAKLVGTSVMMIEKYYGHLVHATARERLAKVSML